MALIPFWTWLFAKVGISLPYGAGWFLSQATMTVVFAVCLLLMLAYILLADRKIWAAVMMRKGPNVVGAFGLLQSFADFFKFAFKEVIVPAGANKGVFFLAPLLSFVLAFAAWAVVPVSSGWVIADINVGILYIFAISSLGVYGIIMGGWASNSKYPFLGGLRSAAQMVSYEVSIGFVIITVLLMAGSLNLSQIVRAQTHGWFVISPLLPMFVVFFVSALAETNRPPFDLPEAESELVAGFMVEYSSTAYLLFMIGEYLNIVLMCAMMTILFFGGWLPLWNVWPLNAIPGVFWFILKVWIFFFMFAMVKAMVPRYRYDQLMRLGWKVFLPLSLIWVALTAGYVLFLHPVHPM
jgi:NADH-quinone oxidoreductase subunit H